MPRRDPLQPAAQLPAKPKSNGKGKPSSKSVRPKYAHAGQPTKYDADKHPDVVYKLCAQIGAEDTHLILALNISMATLTNWKRDYPEFLAAIKKGKADWDDQTVVSALRKRALGYKYDETDEKTMEYVIQRGNKKQGVEKITAPGVETTVHHKSMAPDVTACIFWLVNRQPDEWKHVARTIVQGDAKNPVQHNYKFDLSQLPEKELDNLESIITKARAAKQGGKDNGSSSGPCGTA